MNKQRTGMCIARGFDKAEVVVVGEASAEED